MKKPKLLVLLGIWLTIMLSAVPASAFVAWEFSTESYDSTDNSYSTDKGFSFSLGCEFKVNAPIVVNYLGFYEYLGNALTQAHAVGIWDADQVLLTTATVEPNDPLVGHFRYHVAPPVSLVPGANYVIAAVTGTDYYTWDPVGFFTDPSVAFVSDRYISLTDALVYPDYSVGEGMSWFGPNFATTNPVPLPATLPLLGSGLLGLLGWRRLRKV